jgi:hypothetical protein
VAELTVHADRLRRLRRWLEKQRQAHVTVSADRLAVCREGDAVLHGGIANGFEQTLNWLNHDVAQCRYAAAYRARQQRRRTRKPVSRG